MGKEDEYLKKFCPWKDIKSLMEKRNQAIKKLIGEIMLAKEMKKEASVNKNDIRERWEYESMPISEEAKTYLINKLIEYYESEELEYELDIEIRRDDFPNDEFIFSLRYLESKDCIVLSDPLVFCDKNINYGDAEQILYRIHHGLEYAKEHKNKIID